MSKLAYPTQNSCAEHRWRRSPNGGPIDFTGTEDAPAEFNQPWADGFDRRSMLKIMGASLALGTTACSPPAEEIRPYVNMPEGLVPGEPLTFATSLPVFGPASGVLATSHEGRPTKLEGNPDHPASLGGSDAATQAAVLSLYDPDRTRGPMRKAELLSWKDFQQDLAQALRKAHEDRGRRLRILSGAILSPTLARQMEDFRTTFPDARWHRWQPVNADAAREGARMAFGRTLDARYRFDRCRVVLALDGDPLGPGPDQVRYARDFSQVRKARRGTDWLARLYAVEPTFTVTGAHADRRLALAPHDIVIFAEALAARLAGEDHPTNMDETARAFLDAVAADLGRHHGEVLIVAGERQSPAVHALVHWMNGRLGAMGNTLALIEPVEADVVDNRELLAALAAALHGDAVDVLFVLGGNPAYDAPAEMGFASALRRVPFTVRLGPYEDETSDCCLWHLPESHPLESWSDLRAPDGNASIVQPLITPLFDTRSVHEVVAMLTGGSEQSGHAIVQATWRSAGRGAFDDWWNQVLRKGVIADTAQKPFIVEPPAERPRPGMAGAPQGISLTLAPDASLWDGRFATNAWLQEIPNPLTRLVWGNALSIASGDADRMAIRTGDVVRVEAGGRRIEVPVFVAPGQAAGVVSLPLGHGRKKAGAVGTGVGTNVYPLRTADHLWTVSGASIAKTGRHVALATTQGHHDMRGRDIVRKVDLAALASQAQQEAEKASLYPEYEYDTYAWSMVIDQSVCIGCNACVAACQAENNVPVVGPDEVRRGRDMHWLRIDSYLRGSASSPEVFFQAVPCMHCEKAPCEPVCPVEASVHDGEGLNVQVYNRCIGTRFCQSNCPYKVRRFNFYGYANGQEYADLGDPLYDAVSNPDVSVRARGVMEKCTYCVQRISRARRRAKKENRRIRDGEVVTACQSACPTKAIHFGDRNNNDSDVARLRREPHAYGLLEHLGTRPRTRYLAMVRDTRGDRTAKS